MNWQFALVAYLVVAVPAAVFVWCCCVVSKRADEAARNEQMRRHLNQRYPRNGDR